jgi:hypothetical protein
MTLKKSQTTAQFKGYTVTYRLGSKLIVGTRLIWNFQAGTIVAIDDSKPEHFSRTGTQIVIRYFYWQDDDTGETHRAQLCPKERYRVEVSPTV